MASNLEDIVYDAIEDIGVDAVIEHQREKQTADKARWESWVALSASLLAVLSAIAALYATFAADEAAIAESKETVIAAYASGAEASYHIMQTKVEILQAWGKPVNETDEAQMNEHELKLRKLLEKSRSDDRKGGHEYKTHDLLMIAVALFQLSTLLGGLAVVVQRPALWMLGMSFTLGGAWFMIRGMAEYLS